MKNDVITLAGRVLLALLFVIAGYGKLVGGPANFAESLGGMGFPFPLFFAWATTALELLGGIAILAGLFTRPTAVALALFCVATAAVAHLDFAQPTQLLKNLGLAGGFLLLAGSGAGKISVDALLAGRTGSRQTA